MNTHAAFRTLVIPSGAERMSRSRLLPDGLGVRKLDVDFAASDTDELRADRREKTLPCKAFANGALDGLFWHTKCDLDRQRNL